MKRVYILMLLGFITMGVNPAQALILPPSVDGSIIDGYIYNVGFASKDGVPDQLDSAQSVQVYNNTLIEYRGIMEFDLSSIGSPVTSAYLNLTAIAQNGPFPINFGLYGYAGDGNLNASDFNDGLLVNSFSYDGSELLYLDVTSFIQDLQGANTTYAGFSLRKPEVGAFGGNPTYVAFGSQENLPASQLIINQSSAAVPEPSTFVLLAAGLLGVMLTKNRVRCAALRRR